MPPKKRKRKTSTRSSRFSLFRSLLWISVVLLTSLALFTAMRLPHRTVPDRQNTIRQPIPKVEHSDTLKKQDVRDQTEKPVQTAQPSDSKAAGFVYETSPDDFESKVRGVDLAILQSLATIGQPHEALRHRTIESRLHDGQEFYYQNLTIALPDVFSFLVELRSRLQQYAPEATMATVNDNPRDLEISILGKPTHHLFIPLMLPSEPAEPVASQPRMVIVIDDLGESMSDARRLASLPFPVTFSVLPYTTKAREVANLARREQLELLLHLPCEPEGYPRKADSGPGTLKTGMSAAALEQTLVNNFARLPEVDGVNNHMGSRLTRDKKAMTIILAHLQGRGKFFLDSVTTPRSVVQEVSADLGMPYYRRNIFLDNTPTEQAVLLQLAKAEALARRTGLTIVIGHPYPATLNALESWTKNRNRDIVICTLQEI